MPPGPDCHLSRRLIEEVGRGKEIPQPSLSGQRGAVGVRLAPAITEVADRVMGPTAKAFPRVLDI